MPKALIGITSYNEPYFPDGKKTGFFVNEGLQPFNVFKKNGFEVDFVSETGTFGFDDNSTSNDFLSGQDREDFENPESDFNQALSRIKKTSDIDAKDYLIFYGSAGHGTLFDYPNSKLLKVATEIYNNGGIFATVCHGPIIFDNLINPETGKYLIEGKKITGFTAIGEEILGVAERMEKDNSPTIEEVAKKCGATYVAPPGPFDAFSVVDGRIVTGTNPASATATAVNAVRALQDV
ncbi:uncharacterized protein KQ657_004259 [Scheffersomyces spartinae]|uniref:D-lactate dehydratase n=1 Tax=Scheffersomyces spartinae TaxID=45513 RepID=A0A9P7VB74_9ASCO|nr:uncharacterized protein KQ657_004259 [Scheffersomyces spartinae]KAG7194585.1 hypothetical protein KQ657_004259 [Scheffersomyces spartinae]